MTDAHTGGPAALVFEGAAGIGKTSIWARAVQDVRALGVAVRVCRCTESEARWAFAGLGDLFADLDTAVLSDLPEVQSRALSAALLRSEAAPSDRGDRAVGAAVLGVLRMLSGSGPLMLAVDDLQWMDVSSRNVLTFALRRLVDEPVRLIASSRTDLPADAVSSSDLGVPTQRLLVGPVSLGALQRIVAARLGVTFTRPTLTRLHQASGGNPMLGLEMGRALQRHGPEPSAGEPLPVPADLVALVSQRLRPLSEPARQLLLVAAALAHPTLGVVAAVTGDCDPFSGALAEAVAGALLEVDGERIHFVHPLIASIPYAALSGPARRRLHEQIASAVSGVEEKARHTALASAECGTAVADALDGAARMARSRGSLDDAAEFAELALSRTPSWDHDALLLRTVAAAQYRFLLGDTARARTLLDEGLHAATPGPQRVPGLLLAATIASWESGDATVASRCATAMTEAGDDVLLRARCHAVLADTSPSGAVTDLVHAERAVSLLEAMTGPPAELLANALTNAALHRCRLGRGLDVAMLQRAAVLQAQGVPVPVSDRAISVLGMYLKVVDRFDESRAWLETVRTAAIDEGDDSALPNTLGHLAILECWAARYERSLTYAVEARELATRTGVRAPTATAAHVLALAHLGRLAEARAMGEADLLADELLGFVSAVALHCRSLGVTELMAGHPDKAVEHLLRAITISTQDVGINEPAILRAHPDLVAALVQVGKLEQAAAVTDQLDTSTRTHHQPWSTALAGRCHGLLAIAHGDMPTALNVLEQAMVDHQRLPMPFEQAQTQQLFGNLLRRTGHRRDARRELTAARDTFGGIGALLQAAQADRQLAQIGGRTVSGDLTSVEEHIATLVATGQTNREVAATMFISVRTVESHLSRIYRKLGVRSRTEMSRNDPTDGSVHARS